VNGEIWDVTPDTLQEIKRNFDLGKQRGLDCPVVWNHSNDARDRGGDVDALRIQNDTLVAQFGLMDGENPAKVTGSGGVSVEVREPWHDGLGNEYPLMLTHVGIVNHPVIPGQGQFKRLSLLQGNPQMNKRYAVRQLATGQKFVRRLAEGDAVAPDETATDSPPAEMVEDATSMPALDETQFSEFEKIVNELLDKAYPGLTLPKGTTGENAFANATNVITVAKQLQGDTEEPEAPAAEAPAAEATVDQMSPEAMQLALKQYRQRDAERAAAEEKQRHLAIQQAEVEFKTRLTSLIGSSKIQPVHRDELIETGKARQWSMSILDIFEGKEPQLNTSSKTRKFAASATPSGGDKQMSLADVKSAARTIAGIPQPVTAK